MEQRLQKLLAAAGVGSRRHCETLIATGRVTLDGVVVSELGTRAEPENCAISVDGRPVALSPEKIYILLNKPAGYTSTRSDPHAERTVLDLVKDIDAYLYPVGRLDVDTSGLIILTNDGELTKLLTHPSHQVRKTYRAVVRGRISSAALSRLEKGMQLDDGVTAPARARLVHYSSQTGESTVEISIHEGRKRQIRRMFATLGHRMVRLARTSLGSLELNDLKEGHYRCLTKKEVANLKKAAAPAQRPPRPPSRRGRDT